MLLISAYTFATGRAPAGDPTLDKELFMIRIVNPFIPLPVILPLALNFPVNLAFLDIVPLVVFCLSSGQSDFHLHFSILEIETQRDQGEPLLLHLADEPFYLMPVKEEFPVADRIVVEAVRPLVYGDIHAGKVYLAVFYARVSFLYAGLFLAQRFYLAPDQYDPRLEGINDLVLKPCLLV